MAVAPFKIEVWSADGTSRLLNTTVGAEAAQRVYEEALANLRTGETLRVKDASGALVLSSNSSE